MNDDFDDRDQIERAWDAFDDLKEENQRLKDALKEITLINIGKDPFQAAVDMQSIAVEALEGGK